MKSILSIAAVMLLGASTVVANREYPAAALQYRQWGALLYSGCYSSSDGSAKNSSIKFNSKGACQTVCLPTGAAVLSVQETDCYCGDELPPKDSLVDDSKCSAICPGYGVEKCGANGYWTVYLTSTETDVPYADSSEAAASSSSSAAAAASSKSATATQSAKASIVTIGGQTVVVTAPASSSSGTTSSSSSSGGPNKAAIAAGVVVGVVAIAAIAGGIFLFLRHRRNRAVEEEYRRNAAVSSFITGGNPPTSSGTSFDTRLDPVMAQRRMSDGSIADNQDYSRRILKVTNA